MKKSLAPVVSIESLDDEAILAGLLEDPAPLLTLVRAIDSVPDGAIELFRETLRKLTDEREADDGLCPLGCGRPSEECPDVRQCPALRADVAARAREEQAAVAADRDALATAIAAKISEQEQPAPRVEAPRVSGYMSVRDVRNEVDCSRSQANRYLREAAGRKNGTGELLRVPVATWRRFAQRKWGR